MNRDASRLKFLDARGLADEAWQALPQDASARRYFRLPGRQLLLMDAPPPGEKPAEFVRVTETLQGLGARVPRIHAADVSTGFVLLEDLGDQTFTRLLDAGEPAEPLYRLATEELVGFQRRCLSAESAPDLPSYDLSATLAEVALFVDWYLPARLGRPAETEEREAFLGLWSAAFADLPACQPVLVHRDFHVDNLLLVDARCALIDYQDALLGSPVYDLVSLLEDARRDVDPTLRRDLARHWRHGVGMDDELFGPQYAFWGAQRHCKVAGIFIRLWQRDGKSTYLQHLARVMTLLAAQLDTAGRLSAIGEWVAERLGDVSHGEIRGFKEMRGSKK